jgi:hypothetical protein
MAREDLCVKLAGLALLRPDMRPPDLHQLLGLLQSGSRAGAGAGAALHAGELRSSS